jgi:hypothetical protein
VENSIRDLVNEVGMMEVPERPAGGLTTRKSPEQWEQDYRKAQFLGLARERAEAAQPEGATWNKGLPDGLRNEIEAYHKKRGFFGERDSKYKEDLESASNSTAGDNPIYHAGRWIGSMLEVPFRAAANLGDDVVDAVGPMVYGKDYQPLPAAYKQREREKYDYAKNTFLGGMERGPSYWSDLEDSKLRARGQTPGVLADGRFTPHAKWYQSQVPDRDQAREVAAEYNYRNIPGETSPSEFLQSKGVPAPLAYATGIPASIMLDPLSTIAPGVGLARQGKTLQALKALAPDFGLGSMEAWMPAVTQGIRRLVGEVNKDGRR